MDHTLRTRISWLLTMLCLKYIWEDMFCFKSDVPRSALLRVAYGWLETPALKMFQFKNYSVPALLSGTRGSILVMGPMLGRQSYLSDVCRHSLACKYLCHLCTELAWIPHPARKQSQVDGALGIRDSDLIFHCLCHWQLTHWTPFASLSAAGDSKPLEDVGTLGQLSFPDT